MSQSLASKIEMDELITTGLKKHKDRLVKRGASDEFIAGYDASLAELKARNARQEATKSQLKLETISVNEQEEVENGFRSEAVKMIKLEFEQAAWKEFGISAKH